MAIALDAMGSNDMQWEGYLLQCDAMIRNPRQPACDVRRIVCDERRAVCDERELAAINRSRNKRSRNWMQ